MWRRQRVGAAGLRGVRRSVRRSVGRGGRTFACSEESSGAGVGAVNGRCGAMAILTMVTCSTARSTRCDSSCTCSKYSHRIV